MLINIKTLTGKTISIEVEKTHTIEKVKELVEEQEGYVHRFHLTYDLTNLVPLEYLVISRD